MRSGGSPRPVTSGWLTGVLDQLPAQLRPVHRVRALPEELGR